MLRSLVFRSSRSNSSFFRSLRPGSVVVALLFAAILLPFLFAPALNAQDKTLVWDRFDVDITVNSDGSFRVCEDQLIRFTEGSFTNGYREIPQRNFDYIDDWAVSDGSGNQYSEGWSGQYYFNVSTYGGSDGGSYEINWYFPPMEDESESFLLCYTVHGGLRYYEGGDQLWWKAIYGDRPFPVEAGTVTVNLPPGALVTEYAAYINDSDARDRVEVTQGGLDATTIAFSLLDRLWDGEELEVRVQFPSGVVAGTAASWQAQADAEAAAAEAQAARVARWGPWATILMCVSGLGLLLGGPAALYALWHRRGRSKPVEMVADYLPEPPDELAPGLAGTLLDETVDMEDILATLIDLARRKVVSITEVQQDDMWAKKVDFIYRRERDDIPVSAYEEALLNGLFGRKDEIQLSDLKNKFYKKLPAIRNAMYDAVVKEGLFPARPDSTRNNWVALGFVTLFAAAGIGFLGLLGMGWLTPFAFAPGVGLGVVGIGILILAKFMPRKTDKGAEQAARWEAFRTYLKDIDKYSDLEEQKNIWDRWLPYAIAFGVDKEYMARFAAVDAPSPGWYIPTPTMYGNYRPWFHGPSSGSGSSGGGNINLPTGSGSGSGGGGLGDMSAGMGRGITAMSAGMATMLNTASATMTSVPQSSSSGGGWGGGGFSGGGGGGGGGGGFR